MLALMTRSTSLQLPWLSAASHIRSKQGTGIESQREPSLTRIPGPRPRTGGLGCPRPANTTPTVRGGRMIRHPESRRMRQRATCWNADFRELPSPFLPALRSPAPQRPAADKCPPRPEVKSPKPHLPERLTVAYHEGEYCIPRNNPAGQTWILASLGEAGWLARETPTVPNHMRWSLTSSSRKSVVALNPCS